VALALTGCSIGPPPAPPIAVYDFGPPTPRSNPARLRVMLALDDVVANPQTSSTAILYRLTYQDAAQLLPYSRSRWAAAPAALLGQRLRYALGASAERGVVGVSDGVRSDYVLRVELDQFEHLVDSQNTSRVALRARASLIGSAARSLRAQQTFVVERAAESADAPGAVRALSAATEQMIADLIVWVGRETAGAQ